MAFLKHNWLFKLLALAAAILLSVYVHNQADRAQRTMFREVEIPVPPGQQVAEPKPGWQVTVDLEGPTELVRAITNEDVKVELQTSGLRPGQRTPIAIDVTLSPRFESEVNVDWRPRSVQVRLVSDAWKEMDVLVKPLNPPEGWEFREMPRAAVPRVKVSGSKEVVDRVAAVVAPFNLEPAERISTQATLQALDAENKDITDQVRLEPRQVLVSGMQERVALQKRVPVQPMVGGPPGSRLSVQVTPSTVRVVGPKSVVSEIYVVETARVTVPPGQSQVNRVVPLVVPGEQVEVSPASVRVTVRAQPGR